MRRRVALTALGVVAAACAGPRPPEPSRLVLECGAVERAGSELRVATPCLRAVLRGGAARGARLAFTYRGPTDRDEPLASGELRRQVGLKLRARDTCNVVYVMWHVEPGRGLHVSVKSNPGQSRHAECRDHGYVNVRPTSAREVRPIVPGERRTLEATLEGALLRVSVDGVPSWEGTLPEVALSIDGPVGLRTDNGVFDLALLLPSGGAP